MPRVNTTTTTIIADAVFLDMAAGATAAAPAPAPANATVYVQNVPSKLKPAEARAQLYALFSTYGPVRAITRPGRGQAFIVFADKHGSASALQALQKFNFYGQPLRLEYARTQSAATIVATLGPEALHDPAVRATMHPPSLKRARSPPPAQVPAKSPVPAPAQPEQAPTEEEEMQMDDDQSEPGEVALVARDLPSQITTEMLQALFVQYVSSIRQPLVAAADRYWPDTLGFALSTLSVRRQPSASLHVRKPKQHTRLLMVSASHQRHNYVSPSSESKSSELRHVDHGKFTIHRSHAFRPSSRTPPVLHAEG